MSASSTRRFFSCNFGGGRTGHGHSNPAARNFPSVRVGGGRMGCNSFMIRSNLAKSLREERGGGKRLPGFRYSLKPRDFSLRGKKGEEREPGLPQTSPLNRLMVIPTGLPSPFQQWGEKRRKKVRLRRGAPFPVRAALQTSQNRPTSERGKKKRGRKGGAKKGDVPRGSHSHSFSVRGEGEGEDQKG